MSDQTETPARRGGNPNWVKGGPSPNPRGRPRSGLAFAERVRERIDPDLVIDLALRVAADETMTPDARLAALLPLIDRGFIRPPVTAAIAMETTSTPAFDWSRIPLERRRDVLEAIRTASALPAGDAGHVPSGVIGTKP